MLSSLGALDAGPLHNQPYSAIEEYSQQHRANWLCYLPPSHWFIPRNTSLILLDAAISELSGTEGDTPELRRALLELWLTTRHERMSEEDRDAMLAIYARRLSAYPGEIVALVCRKISEESRFWPSWSEIQAALSELDPITPTLLKALISARKRLTNGK